MTNTNTLRNKVSRGTLERENLLEAQAEKVEMTLNTDNAIASGLLIQRLTELYEDPVEASVRETISNGLDAVTESFSGDRAEIRITKPTSLNPIFIVQDNGVGMSYDDLKEIYSKYGASTKMNNFEQIGAYGLGAKAPLAYGTEFTVSSVKDGVRTTIIVAREELTNYIKIVDSSETTDPSGTTVSIPVAHYDIDRFKNHVEKYEVNPIDKKNVTLFIDGEEVVESQYMEISDDVVIFRKDGEEVTARMWIHNKDTSIVEVVAGMSESDVRNSLSYVIGGWSYKAPHRRGGYHSNNSVIMVELKAGIVGFNSARDAILENERYTELENLVIEYVKSSNFTKKITEAVNKSKIEMFKSVVQSLLRREERNLVIENGKISVKGQSNSSSYYGRHKITREYSISEFVHEETGFSVDEILQGVPKKLKQSAIVCETKSAYKKTSSHSTLTKRETGLSTMENLNFNEINLKLSGIMYGEDDSQSLEHLLCHFMLNVSRDRSTTFITFVTDIKADADEDEKTTDFSRVRSGRKTITKMRGCDNQNQYASYIVYTEHTKAEMEKMIKVAKLDDLNVEIKPITEIVEQMAEYRKNNRTQTTRTKVQISTSISKYNHLTGSAESVDVSEIKVEDGVKNLIILGKQRNIATEELKQIHAWYCNTKELKSDEVVVYASIGAHRIAELETLKELGELHQGKHSEASGTSNLYDEIVKRGELQYHILNNNEDEVEKKAFLRILATLPNGYSSGPLRDVLNSLQSIKRLAALGNIEMSEIPEDKFNELIEYSERNMGGRYNNHWRNLSYSVSHLVSLVTDEQKELIETMSMMDNFDRAVVINDDSIERVYNYNSLNFGEEIIKFAFAEGNEEKASMKLIRDQFTNYMNYVNKFIEDFSAITFD